MTGFVSLVGAGPGAADLLTLRAARRLAEADLVLYDALVDPEALRLAGRAHTFHVGKRAGRPSIRQETIHRLMIGAARKGRRVVRLKCGDPFVLGRGGEEALALEQAGVPYEVVPGVSSALAAPALARIPVTHRGLSTAFAVLSGHSAAALEAALPAFQPGGLTLVILMGLTTRAELARLLVARGWSPATPAALLTAASSARAGAWIGTLAALGEAPAPGAGGDPGTLVVGEVVRLARPEQLHTLTHAPDAVGRAQEA